MDTPIVKEAKASFKENAAKYSLNTWNEKRTYLCGYIEGYAAAVREMEAMQSPTLFTQKQEL